MRKLAFASAGIDKFLSKHKSFSNFVYTPLDEAKNELLFRRTDRNLSQRIRGYLQEDVPYPLLNGPKAVLFRQVVTPNYEFRKFMDVTRDLRIEPLFLEYYEDKFVSCNPLKRSLGKMKFLAASANVNSRARTKTVIEFNKWDGKRIADVHTIWGQKLVDFHHRLTEAACNGCSRHFFDASQWFLRGGSMARRYYSRYIALFVQHGILFENFILDGPESIFVKSIFLPSFEEVSKCLGCKPLIVPLLPIASQADPFWTCYPMELLSSIEEANVVL